MHIRTIFFVTTTAFLSLTCSHVPLKKAISPQEILFNGIEEDKSDLVTFALHSGACVNEKSNYGQLALECALLNKTATIARILLEHGAHPTPVIFEHACIRASNTIRTDSSLNAKEAITMVSLLAKHGATIDYALSSIKIAFEFAPINLQALLLIPMKNIHLIPHRTRQELAQELQKVAENKNHYCYCAEIHRALERIELFCHPCRFSPKELNQQKKILRHVEK